MRTNLKSNFLAIGMVMHSAKRCWTPAAALAVLLVLGGTASYGAPLVQESEMQKIDHTVLGELTGAQADMASIYQEMSELIKQAFESKKDSAEQARAAAARKHSAAVKAVEAKKREIEEKSQAARDQFVTSVLFSMGKCVASVTAAALNTGDSVGLLYAAPDQQRVRGFTANADLLKKRLAKLHGEVNRLRAALNSGESGTVTRDDLEKLNTQIFTSLQHVCRTKSSTAAKIKHRGGSRGTEEIKKKDD
ncbi:MAG: hypothetical protein K9M97_02775 [Akkermansiaceae bacterium]|nr:hypothetical protein [Akkermansiaceae bacterium]